MELYRSSRNYPNPYFFFRSQGRGDLATVARWIGAAGRLSDTRELRVLRQLDSVGLAPMRRSLMAIEHNKPAFLLEWMIDGDIYLTGPPALHASPSLALRAWRESMHHLFLEEGLTKARIPLPAFRRAEVSALQRLGCRKEAKGVDSVGKEWVWVKTPNSFHQTKI